MSQQHKLMGTSSAANLPVKRKRGRPRKDENLVKKENTQFPATPASHDIQKTQEAEFSQSNDIDDNMIGRVVTGVIEGSFDSGYLLCVRIGNSSTLLRGVVFQPGHVSPITATNDVAPNAKLYKRHDVPIPPLNSPSQTNGSIVQSVHTEEQPVQLETHVPVAPNQVLPSVLQPGVPFAINNQFTSVILPPDNMSKDLSGASFARKTTTEQKSDFDFLTKSASLNVPLTTMLQADADTSMGGMKVMQQQISDFRFENQSASGIVPLPTIPINVSNASLDVGKVALQQTPAFGFDNQSPPLLKNLKMVEQDEVMQVFEVPASEPMVSIFPGNKSSDQFPPVQNQAGESEVDLHQTSSGGETQFLLSEPQTESGLCPIESVHNDLHNSNLELHQTPILAGSLLVPRSEYLDPRKSTEPVDKKLVNSDLELNDTTIVAKPQTATSEPTEQIDIVMEQQVSPTKDISDYEQQKPAEKDLSKYEASQNGELVNDIADNTEAGSHPPLSMEDAFLAKPTEESVFSGKVDSQISASSSHTTDMDFVLAEAIPPAQS